MTPTAPTVVTISPASAITQTTATLSGNVTGTFTSKVDGGLYATCTVTGSQSSYTLSCHGADADGLSALQQHTDRLRGRPTPSILTPHPGEFARLLGCDAAAVQARRQQLAVRFAADHGVVLVLKGQGTVVTDGRRCYVNPTGNPGMATGGTGDVLTGLVAALLGQGLEAFAAAQLGVYLHGLAGDLARDDRGEVSLIATDLIEYLPRAFRALPR